LIATLRSAANIIYSSSNKSFASGKAEMPLFKHLVHLLDQTVEDRIRICFVICAFEAVMARRDDRLLIKLVL